MTDGITESVAAQLAEFNAVPRVQDLYEGDGAAFYDRVVGSDRSEVREVLALARRAGGAVLDLAAGSGRLAIPLVRCGTRVTAVDLSADMLSRLEGEIAGNPLLDCVVADMRSFALERRYELIIIGATSITLLDAKDRIAMYASVREHLAEGGIFALTIAGTSSGAHLRVTEDQRFTVDGPDGAEEYLYSQQIVDDGTARVVNWARAADFVRNGTVTVLTSRLRVLDADILRAELVQAGFTDPRVYPVRANAGSDIVLLETSLRGEHRSA